MRQTILGKKTLPAVLLAATASFALASVGTGAYAVWFQGQVNRAIADSDPAILEAVTDPQAIASADNERKEADEKNRKAVMEMVAAKKLFGVENNIVAVQAIVGESALINGKWLSLGQEEDGLKLTSLDNNKAVVQLNGETRDVYLWASMPGDGAPVRSSAFAYEMPREKKIGANRTLRKGGKIEGGSSSMNNGGSGNKSADAARQKARNERKDEYKKKRDEMRLNRQSSLGQ